MEWTTSETMALARPECTKCRGVGLRAGRAAKLVPCGCVLRSIFRICFDRFRHCAEKEKYMSRVTLGFTPGATNKFSWGRKDEEYIADFTIVARRTLNADEHRIFKFHFLLGADWKLCCRQLSMDRGNFFHSVYRIQSKLGRVLRELEPFALYPLDQYFHNGYREEQVRACVNYRMMPAPQKQVARYPQKLQIPVRKAA